MRELKNKVKEFRNTVLNKQDKLTPGENISIDENNVISSFASGGGSGGSGIDATLTKEGQAADAKATGDAISSLSGKIAAIPSGKDGVTPTIGNNGNWYLGDTDTGKPSRGEAGPQGPAGADGYTPQKGTDYWTAADQQAIVDGVLAALPTWEGGSY